MAGERSSPHGLWSGRWAFFLAATGSAIGLGNIWKFPYITGENGGGAFVLVYLLAIAIIGLPVMMAEVMLGRRGRHSPVNTLRILAREDGASPLWSSVGFMGIMAGVLILSFYSVIAGWVIAYSFRMASGTFNGMTSTDVATIFNQLITDPEKMLAWHTIFLVVTMLIVANGVRSGLERAVRYLIPALFLLLLVLLWFSAQTGEPFSKGLHFLFYPDFSKLTANGALIALGHAFFTLSLGMGAIMTYGAYLPRRHSIIKSVVVIAIVDTVVALMVGLVIFPIVFANNLPPDSGPGLIFQTLPLAFGYMTNGAIWGTLFFVMLIFVSWTSAISLIEPAVAWLVESRKISRVRASVWIGSSVWLLGLGTIFSFNILSSEPYQVFGMNFFDLLNYLVSNIMLPLGGLFVAIFVGWSLNKSSSRDEMGDSRGYRIWFFMLRYISPVALIIVFLNAIGAIKL
ncbi:MAG TPA: sodium-dependent transporter [Ectothiorhodospiraceae bacterium]|nr:sodium-dependent transporter [Ectothiorhodospiraceae bacterium]